eukprot:609860-Rhodomonas_salina.1
MASLYDRWIHVPEIDLQIQAVLGLYASHGFPGCIGSVDCVHVPWDRCQAWLRSLYCGKEGFPMISYKVVVSHDGRILSVTP